MWMNLLMAAGVGVLLALPAEAAFRVAKPIWPQGREQEMNVSVGFRALIEPPADRPVTVQIAAHCLYRLSVNGVFVGHGPARGPHGWYRVDRWEITAALRPGPNVVAIEVAGYNANSFYLVDEPSFVQAEIVCGDEVLAATGPGGAFTATLLAERVQKAQRYSFQRPFSEVYRLTPDYDAWKRDPRAEPAAVDCAVMPNKRFLPRRVAYPRFHARPAVWHVAQGTLKTGIEVKEPWKDRSLVNIGPQLKGFPEAELATIPSLELQTIANATRTAVDAPLTDDAQLAVNALDYHILDFGTNLTGLLGATITCREPARLFLTFDEVLTGDDVDFKRLGCVNIIALDLQPGRYAFEAIEPYTLRYLKPLALEGSCTIEHVYLREYVNPQVWQAQFTCGDDRLNRLYAAARETFAQNAVDIFMDCPSRERAGWLCDSFFTARVAWNLSGHTLIEQNFLENFLLPRSFAFLPDGMLPMCYPGDHNDGAFIPNWAMWFVLELEEYLARSGDRAMIDALQPRVLKLMNYFAGFENSDGLLEKLPNWVFVEWSDANKYTQDVNYPTNMLYAATLAAAGRLYQQEPLTAKAERIRETIRQQSFDGTYFVDNAIRAEDGTLTVTRNRTEVCQYYAFYFGTATPESHGPLWNLLCREFGPQRRKSKAHPDIASTNQLPGNVLRLELLARAGRCQQVLDESVDYNLYMADRTGTLWENDGDYASCNHGFASHLAHVLFRDVLGLYEVDAVGKQVRVRLSDVKLPWCEGRVPTPDGMVHLRWWQEGDCRAYRVEAPAGYHVTIDNQTGGAIQRKP